jgi:integrase/recombinase XerD
MMFEHLFQQPAILTRHREGPLARDRERFLLHCAEQGMTRSSLSWLASELLMISKRIDVPTDGLITQRQIEAAADQWVRDQRRRGRSSSSSRSRRRFVQVASHWLRFLERLQAPEPNRFVGMEVIQHFMAYMRDERGYSIYTVRGRRKIIERFLRAFDVQNRPFSEVRIADVDNFLESLGKQNWCRTSIASSARALRSFFRYAGENGWCADNIAAGITGPRIFKQEGLAAGPNWDDVERLIRSTCDNTPRDIRDKAILQLLAIYGLRRGEVCSLRLEDINWMQDRISISRPKQRCTQEYPLLPSVGEAILCYLQQVRPPSCYREIFLTVRAPFRPLSGDGLYDIVRTRLLALGIRTPHYGPHGLRHACAKHMVAQRLSFKEIGDHLGHRSVSATRIYAKVDVAGLRGVADLSLGGLL